MKTSKNGLLLIKHYEGDKLKSYQDQAGVWTIGSGHTHGVKKGDIITQDQSDYFLVHDIMEAEKEINFLKLKINQNEFDALVSFVFNLGFGSLEKSTLLKRIKNKENDSAITIEFSKWNHCDGKENDGLIARRKSEALLFTTGELNFFN